MEKPSIRNLAADIEEVAYVPTQTWNGWNMSWLTSWFPSFSWFKGFLGLAVMALLLILLLPCCIPLCVNCFHNMIDSMVQKQTAAHVMAFYTPLKQIQVDIDSEIEESEYVNQ